MTLQTCDRDIILNSTTSMVKREKGGRTQQFSKMNKAKKAKMSAQTGTSFKHISKASSNPYRPDPSGGKPGSRFRTRATINRLNMYKAKPDLEKMKQRPTDPQAGKIQPDRRWFGNVRTVDQKELDKYRKSLEDNQT